MDVQEGRLKAWLDGELPPEEANVLARRVEEDFALRNAVEELRGQDARVREILDRLGDPTPPTERVRTAVTRARRESGRRGRPRWSRLAQAAALVLFLAAGASAALPGSPVHEWLRAALGDPTPTDGAIPTNGPVGRAGPDETGLAMVPHEGAMRIELVDLPRDAEIVVRLTDQSRVGVFGLSDSGLEWEGEAGRIRARARSGPIRVELPRELDAADLLVNGRVYLLKRGDRMDLRVSPADSSATEIRLRAGS